MPERIAYGDHRSQFVECWGDTGPCVALVHGGYWRARYDLHLMEPLCVDLVRRGARAVNIEYRRTDGGDGRWPDTLDDVIAALDAVGDVVAIVGHSAGGHLALLAGAARAIPVVAQAPLTDLVAGADLSNGAARLLAGDGHLAEASPCHRLPLGVPQLIIVGDADLDVPIDQSLAFAAAAIEAGDDVELHLLAGADHYVHLDPHHLAWEIACRWML